MIEKWLGLNQQARRASIDNEEEWFNENLFAIGPGNLRSCWGHGAAIYTAPAGYTIRRIFFGFYGCGPDGLTPEFGSPPPGRLGWMFISPTDTTNQAGIVDEVDLDSGHVTRVGQIWRAIAPQYWAAAVVWVPQFWGRTDSPLGQGGPGGVLFGSPQGLYAWSNPISGEIDTGLRGPGDDAPDWLTNLAETDPTAPIPPMPIGLPGIYAMEVYHARLWVAGKDVITFSAPSNGANFSTAAGGGSFGYFSNKLVYTYMDLPAASGYLFVFGDASTDIISNIQVSISGGTADPTATTQFNYENLDPQVGQRFPRPVGAWGRFMTMYNGAGIWLMEGGDAQNIGQKTTNIFNTLDTSLYLPTMAPATMFGFRVMLCNGRFTDPFGVTRNLILMWHGPTREAQHWSISSQNLELTNIGAYEQDSIITPYGTDGTSLYQLFAKPDPALPKRLSTKAFKGDTAAQQMTIKSGKRLFLEVHDNDGGGVSFTGTFTTRGGGIPNGVQDVGFDLTAGVRYDVLAWPISVAGLSGALDLYSISPDFTLERIFLATEQRTLFGA